MNLKDKTFLITGILTDKSIAFSAAKIALENGATIIATGFGDGLRITQRAVKRLDGEIEVIEMDVQNTEQVQDVAKFVKDNYGKIDIELGQLQVIKRGDVILPLDGGPDILRAVYSKMENNKRIATNGDCFFQMVDWDENGNVSAESIHQYGSATIDKSSPHYSDQSYLFSNMKMKPSFIVLDSIKKYTKVSYSPYD